MVQPKEKFFLLSYLSYLVFRYPTPIPRSPYHLKLYFISVAPFAAHRNHNRVVFELFNLIQFGSRAHCDCTNIRCTWSTVASCGVTEKNSYLSKSLSYGQFTRQAKTDCLRLFLVDQSCSLFSSLLALLKAMTADYK